MIFRLRTLFFTCTAILKPAGVKVFTLDAFPVHGLRNGGRVQEFVFRWLLAWRLRACARPVLLTHDKASRRYFRLLVPIGFGPASKGVASIAARLAPGAQLAFLNAYRVPESENHDGARSVEAAIACRVIARDSARANLDGFVDALGLDCARVSRVVQYGPMKDVVATYANRMRADLVILALPTSGCSIWPHSRIASHLLACTSADVLLVPPGSARA